MRLLRRMVQQALRVPGSDPYAPGNNPYNYDPHLGIGDGGSGYPGDRAPPPDLTDEAQHLGLDPREGDTEVTHRTLNHPWGKVVQLFGDGKSQTLVQTEAFPRPFPWAIQARFSLDGKTFTPTVPGTWGGDVIFKFTKSFDVKTGPARETFDLIAGDPLPICALIARKLTVEVKIVGESVLALWVAFVVCPTQQIDCAEASGIPGGGANVGRIFRVTPADLDPSSIVAPGIELLVPNPTRKGFVIQNHAETTLYVALHGEARPPSDDTPLWTVILPPLVSEGQLGISQFAADNYTGPVFGVWDGADGDPPPGYAMVTELTPT